MLFPRVGSTTLDSKVIVTLNRFKATMALLSKYLQNEHYPLWEVIEFGDSYQAPLEETGKGSASESSAKKKRKTGIVSHLEFIDVEIEQDDLNQKFFTSLAPEWLMYTIVWRNRDDLDTMSQDDMYNHLKVYKPEVQKKSETNSQNMAFISSSNTSSGKADSISHDTICAYIASQSNGSQIKYEDITQINEDDIKEIDIKWNGSIEYKGGQVLEEDWECRAPRSQDRCKRESYRQGPKEEEQAPKALMAIDEIRWDWSYMANEKNTKNLNTKITKLNEELSDSKTNLYHYKLGLSQVEARLVEFKTQEIKLCEKIRGLERDVEVRNNKIENLMNELEQTGLPEFADDTVTDYSRPTPSIDSSKSNTSDLQNSNFFVFEPRESSSSIMSKPMIKFVKVADSPGVIKTNKTETARKPPVKYAEMYRNTSKSPKVRGNQRNWNNLKSQQLGKDFVMQNKACFKCSHFDHLAYDCGVWVEKGKN
nr:ribonuclease H-like domain-containing protein [Tanacetum cinerariifolium]